MSEESNDRRGFMTKLLAGTVAAAGTMWLPAGIKEKVEEEGLSSLTLEEVNSAFKAMNERMNELEDRIKNIEDKDLYSEIYTGTAMSGASPPAHFPRNLGSTGWTRS